MPLYSRIETGPLAASPVSSQKWGRRTDARPSRRGETTYSFCESTWLLVFRLIVTNVLEKQLGNCVGRGQFGSVYRALILHTGQAVAVKRIRLEGLKEDDVMQLMREVDLVKSLSHPSIVKHEGMARDGDTLNIVLE